MSTYGAMQDRISDEVRDASSASASGISSQIQNAIQSAIKHYERERFWFNEGQFTFTTSNSAEYYTISDFPNIEKVIEVDTLNITINGNWKYPLNPRTFQYMDEVLTNPNYTGEPDDFCYYKQAFRFYPIPNGAYPILVSAILRQSTLSATDSTNDWMTYGEELIRSRAEADIQIRILKDKFARQEAQMLAAQNQPYLSILEKNAFNSLISETVHKTSAGFLRPTSF